MASPPVVVGFTVFLGALTAFFSLISKGETRREFAVSLFFQNGLFFPLAILTGMFGSSSPYIVDLFFFMLFFPSLLFSTVHLFYGKTTRFFNWGKIINRVLLATVAATTLRLVGGESIIPGFVISALGMVWDTALPLLLLILGGNMYVDFREKGSFRNVLPAVTLSLFVHSSGRFRNTYGGQAFGLISTKGREARYGTLLKAASTSTVAGGPRCWPAGKDGSIYQ